MPTAAGVSASPVTFSGERPVFRRLVMRGAWYELVTFGFYRFWLATDIRRHLWSHTAIDGDPAEYTGTPKELLIGFLFAIAILVPVYVGYFLLGIEAELLQAFASLPLVLFLYFFAQFAIYRARRYRMTRTVWRGLRFSMGGSGWSYAWRAALWNLLVMISLGLALPWRMAALERFKMRHTAYGSLAGRFDGTGGELFRRAWFLWLLTPVAMLLVIPLPFVYAAFKGIEWRWWVSGLRFGEVTFGSDLDWSALLGCYWKVIGWYVLLTTVLALWAGALLGTALGLAKPGAVPQEVMLTVLQQPAVIGGVAVGYLLTAVMLGAVVRLYLNRDVWARVAATTVVFNTVAATDIAGQGIATSALGEGLADSLDIGGF